MTSNPAELNNMMQTHTLIGSAVGAVQQATVSLSVYLTCNN